MKRLRFTLVALLCWAVTTLNAQNTLPENYSIALGSGITLPSVEGNVNDFFGKNGNRAGYDLMAEGRYYFLPQFAAGLQYDYLNIQHRPDKMHLHYIRPNVIYRYLFSNGTQGIFLSAGIGYMNYQERTYKRGVPAGHLYQRGYCGLSLGMGYEFKIASHFSGAFRLDMLTADWFANPDARLSNPYDYDDGVNHSFFKNNITFFNIGLAVVIGK